MMKNFLILFGTIILFQTNSLAQRLDNIEPTINGTEFQFPPLKAIIDSVIKRSAMVSFRKNHLEVKEAALKSERLAWTKNFGVQADGRYGTLNSLSNTDGGLTNTTVTTLSTQYNYTLGVFLKIPVFDVFNRKHQVQLAKMEVEEAKSMSKFQEEEIRQTVIKLYQDLLLKQKILFLKTKNMGDGRVNMEMVDKEFRNGIVSISEYFRFTSMTATFESDYEIAKSEFVVAKQMLEDMAGFIFNEMTSKKENENN